MRTRYGSGLIKVPINAACTKQYVCCSQFYETYVLVLLLPTTHACFLQTSGKLKMHFMGGEQEARRVCDGVGYKDKVHK